MTDTENRTRKTSGTQGTVRTNPSRKRSFSKTLSKQEEFEASRFSADK